MIKVNSMDTPLHSAFAELSTAAAAQPAGAAADWNAEMLERTETLCRSGSFEVDLAAGRITMSAGLMRLLGLPLVAAGEQARLRLDELEWVPPEERDYVSVIWRSATHDEPFEFEHRVVTADGRRLVVLHRGVVQPGTAHGRRAPLVGVGMVQDITAQREAEEGLRQARLHNEVTGLPNRAAFLDVLDAAVHAARWQQGGIAVLALDVPRIAEVKASMGFGAGDTLSMALASRLRERCAAGESLAQLGDGEFALMVETGASAEPALLRQRAKALAAAVEEPVRLGATDIHARARVGIARHPDDAATPAALIEAAQQARLGVTSESLLAFFQPESNAAVVRQMQLESALRRAVDHLQDGTLTLAYQPQVALSDGRVRGVEALLRWHDEALGEVSPGEFLPLAERLGLIGAIAEFVLVRACRQAGEWRRAGLPVLRIGVNLPAAQLQRPDLARHVQALLREAGAEPAWLAVEVSERNAVADLARAAAVLRALKGLGVEVALDNFGSGESSIGCLRSLPLDLVKIDRSFVHDVTGAPGDVSVTRAIITMAHGLQLQVLAEGVETESQLALLAANTCDAIQGRWFAAPMAPEALEAFVRSGARLPERFVTRTRRTRTVLLVDDEENILSALKRLLRRDGYRIITAGSAEEGLQRLAEEGEVDVIVSDQRMPGMNGVEFLRRAKDLVPHTVRMVLSGYTELQSIIDAVNEGAIYRFLTKPWDDQHLRAHVAEAMRHKEMADENRRLAQQVETANADLARLNEQLAQSAAEQREHAGVMADMAGGLREVLDELPLPVLGIDPDGLVAFANRRAAQAWPEAAALLGHDASELPDRAAQAADGAPIVLATGRHRLMVRPLKHGSLDGGRLLMLLPGEQA
jgi:diguanylate cyclase (GGDEF)-like protein